MPGKVALVDYNKCDPSRCEGGMCAAVKACPRKRLTQEAPFEAPMGDGFPCKACGDCAESCPVKAILIVPG